MIEDRHERTRAILWCIADARPDMPVLEALGVLRAVEHQLDVEEANIAIATTGAIEMGQLVRKAAENHKVRAMAVDGDTGAIVKELMATSGCSQGIARAVANSLVMTLKKGPT